MNIFNNHLPRKTQLNILLIISMLLFVGFNIGATSATDSYQITFNAQEISGGSSNFGFIFLDGVKLILPCQLSISEGRHSIYYYPADDYQFSEWDSDGLVLGSTSENANIVHVNRSGSIKALYRKGPELDVNIVHPKNNDEVNGSIVSLSVIISHLNTPIANANVSFYINETIVGHGLSNAEGIAILEYPINPFLKYIFEASANKREYIRGSTNSIVFKRLDIYRYYLMTNNGEDIYTSNFYIQAKFYINNYPAADVASSFYLDGNYLGTTFSAANGWTSIRINDISFGNHSWYVIFSKEDIFKIQSDSITFLNYGEILVEIFPSLKNDINFNEEHIITLNTKIYSNGYPINGMNVLYYINNTLFGTKRTNEMGVSSFEYEFKDINEQIVWYSNIVINNEVEIKSKPLQIYSVEYVKPLKISPIYPVSNTMIQPYTPNISLTCEALIEGVPIENVSIYFYINNSYLGLNYTDKSGIATFRFSPRLDGHTYEWFVVGSKENSYLNETMKSSFFYQPIKPQDIYIIYSSTSDDRTNINNTEVVSLQLIWNNGSYVKNRLVDISGNITKSTNKTGWVIFNVKESKVSRIFYKVINVQGEGVNKIYDNKTSSIIWDMIVFQINTTKNRINLGSTLEPNIDAYYEFDKTRFIGEFKYNTFLYSNKPELKTIYVETAEDELYNITTISSNVVNICWDMILFYNKNINNRHPLGETLDIDLEGYYYSDNTSFEGTYQINNNIKNNIAGETTTLNLTIDDVKYRLTKYAIITDDIILDKINVKNYHSSKFPGKIKISIVPTYQSDNSIVNASIRINNKIIPYDPQDNVYKYTSPALFLLNNYYLRVDVDNFEDITMAFTIIHFENIFCLISFSMISFSIASVLLRFSAHSEFGNKWRYLTHFIQKYFN